MAHDNVKFKYALDAAGEVIRVDKAERGHDYICRGCRAPVLYIKTVNVSAHFRHKQREFAPGQHCDYQDESFAHRHAKTIILEQGWVMAPPVLPRCPEDYRERLFPLRPATRIEPAFMLEEKVLYEGPDCQLHVERPDQPLELLEGRNDFVCRPDITFLDVHGKPQLLIEIRVTHQVDELKLAGIRRARVDAIEITIPIYYQPQRIAAALQGYGHTQWLFNREQERAPAVGFPAALGAGEDSAGAEEVPLLEPRESLECQLYEVGEAVRSLRKALELPDVRDALARLDAAEREAGAAAAGVDRRYEARLTRVVRRYREVLSLRQREVALEQATVDGALGLRRAEAERRVGQRLNPAAHVIAVATAAVRAHQGRLARVTDRLEARYSHLGAGIQRQIDELEREEDDVQQRLAEWDRLRAEEAALDAEERAIAAAEEHLEQQEATVGAQERQLEHFLAERARKIESENQLAASEARANAGVEILFYEAQGNLTAARELYDQLCADKRRALEIQDAKRRGVSGN
jgi:hypothetical protein